MFRHILLPVFLLFASFSSAQCLKADVIFMLDWSGSEDSNRVYIPSAAFELVDALELGPSAVKVGIIPFNYYPILSNSLYPSADKAIIHEVLATLMCTAPSGSTSFPTSFQLAKNFFDQSEEERKERVLRIVLFISDGDEEWAHRELTLAISSIMKKDGIFIWCIATPNAFSEDPTDPNRCHLQQISSGALEGFYMEYYYSMLKEELTRLNLCP
jgi:Mg-chelatase subunit ChlD